MNRAFTYRGRDVLHGHLLNNDNNHNDKGRDLVFSEPSMEINPI
jgi:hypothetical protein